MYVDDVISGGNNITKVKQQKVTIIRIFQKANFKLHKWYSNIKERKGNDEEDGLTYAKSQLAVRQNKTKILGVSWDKATDQIVVK